MWFKLSLAGGFLRLTTPRLTWYKPPMYALLCTLGVFCFIVVLSWRKVPLALAILAGALAEGLLLWGVSTQVPLALAAGLIQPDTVGLLVITSLQIVLSGAMQQGGQMERLVGLARQFFRRPAVAMCALPALIGLLPMPGGALFSAPMVESAACEHRVEPARLSAINYWYRHIWEHWWPLYPGVMMAIAQTNSTFLEFARYQFPLCFVMIAAGLPIFRGTSAGLHRSLAAPPPGTKRKLLWSASSIWVILAVWVPLDLLLRRADLGFLGDALRGAAIKYFPLGTGLLAAVAWTAQLNRLPGAAVGRLIIGKQTGNVAALVVSVMIFKHVIDTTGAAGQIAAGLREVNLPSQIVIAALPFIAGAVTGLAMGFVGTSFPIVVPLALALAADGSIRPYIALAYAFGHLGQMISPLHLCQVVSNRYFNTPFRPVYRHFLPSWLLAAAGSVGYATLLWFLLK